MLFATVLFFDDRQLQRAIDNVLRSRQHSPVSTPSTPHLNAAPASRLIVLSCLGFYAASQLLLPLRHFLIPGHADWIVHLDDASPIGRYPQTMEERISRIRTALKDISAMQ